MNIAKLRKIGFAVVMLIAAGLLLSSHTPVAMGTNSAQEGSQHLALTVYNEGTALVQDRRLFSLEPGLNTVTFREVASSIDPTSVHFTSLTDPDGTSVLEQNYVYDLVGTDALLERYLDSVITVVSDDGTSYTGRLLSSSGDIILEGEEGQVMVIARGQVRDFAFPALPEGLMTRPSLVWLVYSEQGGEQEVELTYLTGGINWQADYTILVNQDETAIDLDGWVTLNNTSGATYPDAQLKLIAGDVSRVQPEVLMYAEGAVPVAPEMAPPSVEQREFFEYHLYEIGWPVTVRDNETKQIEFVSAAGVPAQSIFVYDGGGPFYGYSSRPITDPRYGPSGVTDVNIYLEFETGEENGLGADLPAGRVRVYQRDVDGAALLIGEDEIDHTPEGETVRLYLGNAFDLIGERVQTDFRMISDRVIEETYQITLRNHKDEDTVEIRAVEHMFRWSNWEIVSASTDWVQLDSATIEFRVTLAPGEERTITYTVRYSWP